MCDLCKGGEITPEKLAALREKTKQNILNRGQEVRFVYADDDNPSFAYTIGRTLREQPELLITGDINPGSVAHILNDLGDMINEHPEEYTREAIGEGILFQGLLGNNLVAYLAPVRDLREAQMFGVIDMFPDATWAIQIIWPDSNGRLPMEADYILPQEFQPIYCEREN